MGQHFGSKTRRARFGIFPANRGDNHIDHRIGKALLHPDKEQVRIGVEWVDNGGAEISSRYTVAVTDDIDGTVLRPGFEHLV